MGRTGWPHRARVKVERRQIYLRCAGSGRSNSEPPSNQQSAGLMQVTNSLVSCQQSTTCSVSVRETQRVIGQVKSVVRQAETEGTWPLKARWLAPGTNRSTGPRLTAGEQSYAPLQTEFRQTGS